ncbi:MAG: hypothetical protein ABFS46_09590 [Myxococcota bacterium]
MASGSEPTLPALMEHRPATGSCARCRASLGLAAVKAREAWYCCTACAEGRRAVPRPLSVPEARLYGRPQRFYRARRPKELRGTRPGP